MWKLKRARMRARVVVEAVHDARREDDERARSERARAVAEVERELALDDEERIRMLAMDMSLRSSLARPVVELGDRELLGLDENRGSTLLPVRDAVALGASRTADDDLAATCGRNLDVEEVCGLGAGDQDLTRRACGDMYPGVRLDHAVLEDELAFPERGHRSGAIGVAEHDARLWSGANLVCAELLEVGEHGTSA